MTSRKIGVLLSYVLMVLEVLSTLLLTPFILRTLGQAEYGVYRLAASINAYLLLLDLGVGNAIVRYISKYRVNNDWDSCRKFYGIANLFYWIVAVVSLIVGLVLIYLFPIAFATGLNSDEVFLGQKLLFVCMVNSAITLGTTAPTNVIIAYEKFGLSKGASIIQILVRFTLSYLTLAAGWGSLALVIVQLITTILCRSFFVLYVRYSIRLKSIIKNIDKNFIKEVFAYSAFILLQMVATQLNATVGQIMLGVLVVGSSAIIGIYSVGTQVVQYYQSIGSAFTGILMPGVVRLVETTTKPEHIENEMIRIGRIIFIVLTLILSVYCVCGQDFIILWAGEENSKAYLVSLILMSAYALIISESVGSQVLWAMNAHKEQSIAKISIVLANILISIVLIKRYELIGAAVGTFLSLLIGDIVVMNCIFHKRIRIDLRRYYKGLLRGIWPCILITIIIGCLIHKFFIVNTWTNFILMVLFSSLIYIGAYLSFGASPYERRLIRSAVHKFAPHYRK